jgi:hypothetical protein
MGNLYSVSVNAAAIVGLSRVINGYVGDLLPMPERDEPRDHEPSLSELPHDNLALPDSDIHRRRSARRDRTPVV